MKNGVRGTDFEPFRFSGIEWIGTGTFFSLSVARKATLVPDFEAARSGLFAHVLAKTGAKVIWKRLFEEGCTGEFNIGEKFGFEKK